MKNANRASAYALIYSVVYTCTFSCYAACVYIAHCSEEREEASKLMEEADMPLDTLLAQYVAGREGNWGEGQAEGGF